MQISKKFLFLKIVKYFLIVILINIVLVSFLLLASAFFSDLGPAAFYSITFVVSIIIFVVVMFVFKRIRGDNANVEFASIIAHKLKNSLSAVKWSLKMFLDGDFGQISGEQRDVVTRLYEKNEKMILTLNNLLYLNQIQTGAYAYRKTEVDLASLMQSMINDYYDEINKKNIKLEFIKPNLSFPKLFLDKEKIDSAIQNIFDNAIKHTPEGGKLKIVLRSDERCAEIQIKDSGDGIPRDKQSRVFAKKPGVTAQKLKSDSSGLGLFLARNVIRAHKGKIWFESEEGQGTSFYVSLPLIK
jgi:signal transduction histidine kinase